MSVGGTIALYAARHAKPVAVGICYGQTDVAVELAPDEAAQRLIEGFAALSSTIRTIWTSPLRRTRELAQCLAARCGLVLHVDERLMELNFGAWEGRSWDEIYHGDQSSFATWAEDPLRRAPPEGETALELLARIQAWLGAIPDDTGLVITHAGPIRVLRALSACGHQGSRFQLDFERAVPALTLEPLLVPRQSSEAP